MISHGFPDPTRPWSRRDLIVAGALATFARGKSAVSAEVEDDRRVGTSPTPPAGGGRLRTPLCDLLGITHPVLQAPMAGVVTPEMVAAVGKAGGLGVLPGVGLPPEELRGQIRRVRSLSDRPFGVNLLLHPDIHHPPDPDAVPRDTLERAMTVLNRFRERLGVSAAGAPRKVPNVTDAAFEVILEERVPVFSVGLGVPPADWVTRCHAQGAKVIAMASNVAGARELAAVGVDAIVAQGSEAGGHRSTWERPQSPDHGMIGSLALVPQVVDAVRVPVIAAGGITDGRQLLASLVLGAGGALLGTRFIATRESGAPAFHQQALVKGDSDATVVTNAFSGLFARVLHNVYSEEYRSSGAPVIAPFLQYVATADLRAAAVRAGNRDYYPLFAGQGIGLIRDVPSAAEVIASIVQEAERTMEALPRRVGVGR